MEGNPVIRLDSLDPASSAPRAEAPTDSIAASGLAHPSSAARATSPANEPAPSTGDDLLARAEGLRRSGDYEAARGLYRRVGAGAGATAEAAWLALARMELALGRTDAARQAAASRRDRFGQGSLGPEAQWLEVRIHRQAGQDDLARQVARDLIVRWPTSPQAAAAQRALDSP
jgi:Tfp pilus assembly protein PilF